jgi:hypothetical protein
MTKSNSRIPIFTEDPTFMDSIAKPFSAIRLLTEIDSCDEFRHH